MIYPVPNTVIEGDGFYISYNNHDHAIYGCDTTALVFGQMQAFYILNGDHRAGYAAVMSDGYDACLSYFLARPEKINKFSDKVPEAALPK
ncbi:hypothetical protein [Geoalkalibacter subterraneus]|uniref:Uncharacterized protein n=1 Tax=Geoalkalibacter subterraneus TaxID=483547 RepID=A0A0B5FLC7_9BACT|nr:hypothetical protein [Geoalkalibacter subterraneus]AJF08203.1 hypothetical protein GSUB_17085 [Geoalkalibacter subterraneus]